MASIGLTFVTALILLVTIMFHAGILMDFIRPSVLQVQLLGVLLLLFGVVVLLAFDGSSVFGFTIGLIGLFTGMIGSFRDSNTAKSTDQ
ncbi:hypothetical protein [Paenibacillus macquariensis]|uniref:Holin n=1 Tax=Paenibacillus macquariensis TaxID=948756 RepID=A0ABY1JU20_9BACL|nr:hypothetical protein [Paenibacillus macquariensis]MEC0091021.1 hypothetical protein [Paenibacillus macquariensis]OAB34739.1 hypothetical protein PMSM_12895 [Paenibacillus macquariensis subsp. macquariensis]SIQ78406.1 hypothetical protein SAMN05421578_10436 [Paenibacillus macquariensis]